MSGWNREAFRELVKTRTILVVVQVVSFLGFLLPWSYPRLTFIDVIRHALQDQLWRVWFSIYDPVAYILCFAGGLVALLVLLLGYLRRVAWIQAVRTAVMLNGLVLAGSLLFIQPWPWYHTSIGEMIDHRGLGWFLTLAGSLASILFAIGIFRSETHARSMNHEHGHAQNSLRNRFIATVLFLEVIVILGIVLIVSGFYRTWFAGEGFSFEGPPTPFDIQGSDFSGPIPLSYTVAVLAVALYLIVQFSGLQVRETTRLVAETAVFLSLTLTVFLCFTFPVLGRAVDVYYQNVTLELGLYLCVMGQLLVLTALRFLDWSQFRHPKNRLSNTP